jgi:hypothetical protein
MGYNPLSLDSDTMLVGDIYSFTKSPVFSSFNALFQDDGGGINCGVAMIQVSAFVVAVRTPHATDRNFAELGF